jgi:peroxiredoxin
MESIKINQKAPDFETLDFNGDKFKLSDFAGKNNVLIVLNRGFV